MYNLTHIIHNPEILPIMYNLFIFSILHNPDRIMYNPDRIIHNPIRIINNLIRIIHNQHFFYFAKSKPEYII